MRWTPPGWMRSLTPWWFLWWLNDHTSVCWANVVMWKEYGDREDWWPTETCFAGSPDGYDYCGKFPDKGEAWYKEQHKAKVT